MPAHPYANYTQYTAVYSTPGLTQTQLESHYLPAGARYIDARLSRAFTVPFSSNNLTARDLNIYAAQLLFLQGRTSKQDDAAELRGFLDKLIDALVIKNGSMSLSDDTVLAATGAQFDVYSTTQDYTPVFNLLDPIEQQVDSDRLNDEADAID